MLVGIVLGIVAVLILGVEIWVGALIAIGWAVLAFVLDAMNKRRHPHDW